MMSNERQSQVSTPEVVAKNNLKQTGTKVYRLKNKENKVVSTYFKLLSHTMVLSSLPVDGWKNEEKKRWVIIDEKKRLGYRIKTYNNSKDN